MTYFNGSIRFIDQFLINFQPLFTNTQMSALRSIVYGMFHDYKRLNLSAVSRKTNVNYQKLQYFFSESDWDINKLNDVRLNILQNQWFMVCEKAHARPKAAWKRGGKRCSRKVKELT